MTEDVKLIPEILRMRFRYGERSAMGQHLHGALSKEIFKMWKFIVLFLIAATPVWANCRVESDHFGGGTETTQCDDGFVARTEQIISAGVPFPALTIAGIAGPRNAPFGAGRTQSRNTEKPDAQLMGA
jgi:hypothetical protein